MAFVSADEIRARLADVNARRLHYEKLSASQANRLKRHEVWRHAYLADPYLLGAPDDRVAKRFCEIFMNTPNSVQTEKSERTTRQGRYVDAEIHAHA